MARRRPLSFSLPIGIGLGLLQALSTDSLDGALRRIDAAYPRLAAVRQDLASAAGKARERRGAFDPSFTLTYEAMRYNTPSSRGKAYDYTALNPSLQWLTPSGLTYFAGSRLNGGVPKSPLSATGETGEYYVGVRLPLLRDLGINEKSVALRQAELSIPYAERNVSTYRLGILRDGATAYWGWVAAGERLGIARELTALARQREDQVRRRFEAGDEREMSVVEARAETRRREGLEAQAERDLQKAAIRLSVFLNGPPGAPPPLPAPQTPVVSAEEAEAQAERRRPEFGAITLMRRIVEYDLALADNVRKPILDLSLTAGYDTGPLGVGPTPKLSLTYSIPLRQNVANGRREDAQARLRKIDLDRQGLLLAVRAEVADALSATRLSLERLEAARREQTEARRLLRMERRGFELGEGTLFLLNQRERAAAEADSRVVDALAEYHQSVAAFRAATGELLTP